MHSRPTTSSRNSAASQQPPALFEKTIHFSQAQAIVWQVKFVINQITSKKMMTTASNELDNLSREFGKDFDRYLLRELIEQIDLKDPVRAQKDKNEPFKVQLLNQELQRCNQKPEFLQYFSGIAQHTFGDRTSDFLVELTKRLRLSSANQLLVALSIFESCKEESQTEALKILKQKLIDYHSLGRPEPLPEYAAHRLMFHLLTNPELNQDESLRECSQYIKDSNPMKAGSSVALRSALHSDLLNANTSTEDPSISLTKEGTGLESLDKSYKILQPWQLLLDLGHFCTYNYNYLLKILEEFKDISELTMAKTLLYLSQNHTGTDDLTQRIVYNVFDACKKGEASSLSKEPSNKKTQMTWSIDNLARAFRELYSTLNWAKVFEALSDIEEDILLDQKAFNFFLQLFNKSKPQNLGYPLNIILNYEWSSSALQLNFIQNTIIAYVEKKEKTINFSKTDRRQDIIDEITGIKEKVPIEALHVWLSVDLVEKLLFLSESHNFTEVRQLFDYPIKNMPEYLLLNISQCKPERGSLMIDELLSLLLPQFLGNHINSIPALQQLWKNNQALMIRGICELCRHDQRIMNLSRVLDITQEVKESLMPIVNCEDYYFAVNLGILAGKRDFLHYDVWLKGRIDQIGSPFIKALIKYLKDHIILPIQEYMKKHTQNGQLDVSQDVVENHKAQVLERSHLSKEKLCITIEHLSNLQNQRNQKIKEETHDQIRELMTRINDYYPSQTNSNQSSDAIDNAANDYFQRVFSAEPHLVEQKIEELIETMKRFKDSDVRQEQEIYACMLHSLFDEYRFLHRYPSQYLEKIAKLFGAIIKHRIIDGTLQDIALKFALEAFRREGKRQKFGVITIRQFFDMLPQFPEFFENIYEIRNSAAQTDILMVQDIQDLYERTMLGYKPPESAAKSKDQKRQDDQKSESRGGKKQDAAKEPKDSQAINQMPSIDNSQFLKAFQENTQKEVRGGQQQQQKTEQSQPRPTLEINSQSKEFIPSFKKKENQAQESQSMNAIPSSLNIQSEEFKAKVGSSQMQQQVPPPIVQPRMMADPVFRPAPMRSPAPQMPQMQPLNPQIQLMQDNLNAKLQKAIQENAKIKLEDLIEDSNLPGPSPDQQEQIKFICNNTGKNNFNQKLEELKALVNTNPQVNLTWVIHFILTRRISQNQNINNIYIELIKQLNPQEAIPNTLAQVSEIFKKCMLIDEEVLMRVVQRSQAQGSLIKQHLANLGQFIGALTVAGNRPILAREIDLKKLLVDGFFSDKLRYIVTFVCRIMKECKSSIFKPQNPWIKANLEVLREIYDWALNNNHDGSLQEILHEIDATSKILGLHSIQDIKDGGFLKAAITRQFQTSTQQIEVGYLQNKTQQLVPPRPQLMQPFRPQFNPMRVQSISPIPQFMDQTGMIYPNRNMTPSNDNILSNPAARQDIFERVVVSQDFASYFDWLKTDIDKKLRAVVGKAVDSSIVEILPPVVDRSVTIALITTKELVLKDFAYDGDDKKILKAADLIVQNLAGSLALVTCREPLKMSLTTNLKRSIQQLVQEYNIDDTDESKIQDIANIASRENLELGCLLIKKSVIDKALQRVREDIQMRQAIERRKNAGGSNGPFFVDEAQAQQLAELPPQLKPNPNGLTESEFQVYEDFARLRQQPKQVVQESNISDIDLILRQLDRQQNLDEVIKYQITQKLQLLTTENDQQEQQKLWVFCQKWMQSLCDKFIATNDQQQVNSLVEILSFIISSFKGDDLQKKLTKFFLEMNETFTNNLGLTQLLLKNSIISISEWDIQISQYLKDYVQFQQQDGFIQFIINFIEESIINENVFIYTQFPYLISVIEKISEQPNIGQQFASVLEDLKVRFAWNKETLRNYFHEWVAMSFEENNPRQEQEVNKFFYNLQQLGLYRDSDIMYNFCKVMVEVSIERALFNAQGERRPSDRLDYRYIESFLKLMVVLLKTSDINKHEFMSKLFEAIQEVLDEDHKNKKAEFNQKPYYRLLINILTAVNNSQFFNPKTHLLILFSLADLFSKLNPNKYPAFSFAWLELISHKQFMPHFLAFSQNNQQLQQYNAFVGNLYQSIGPAQQQQRTPGQASQLHADNTFYQKWFKFKELIQSLFTFLKNNMIPGQPMSEPLVRYYEATLRVVLVIRHDFPEFLCDFYFNFVNSLPEHCIQLRNIILSANPRNIPYCNPFSKNLKVDTIKEIKQRPRMLCMSVESQMQNLKDGNEGTTQDHHVYLTLMNLREDLEEYFRTKNPRLIQVICEKMMQSEEIINGRRKINSNIINAVALYIGDQTQRSKPQLAQKESYEMFKKIILTLNNETRWCFLNCLVNELRYINSYTYFFSWIVIYLFLDIEEAISEQVTRILIERLQVHEPYPWGLCITFRELLQNPKYLFVRKSFVVRHMALYDELFATKLQPFQQIWLAQKSQVSPQSVQVNSQNSSEQ